MAQVFRGTDPREIADARMDKQLSRSGALKMAPTLLEQIKAQHPDNWREVIAEMRYEHNHPEYVTAKAEARKRFERAYFDEVPAFDRGRVSQEDFVKRRMRSWISDNIQE